MNDTDKQRFEQEGFTFHEWTLRPDVVFSINQYVEHHTRHVGSFLYAALCNDLTETITHADDDNMRNLPALVTYLYWNIPSNCWGSKEKVDQYIANQSTSQE